MYNIVVVFRGWDCYIFYNISNDVFNSNEFDDEVNKNDEQRFMDEGWCEIIVQLQYLQMKWQ